MKFSYLGYVHELQSDLTILHQYLVDIHYYFLIDNMENSIFRNSFQVNIYLERSYIQMLYPKNCVPLQIPPFISNLMKTFQWRFQSPKPRKDRSPRYSSYEEHLLFAPYIQEVYTELPLTVYTTRRMPSCIEGVFPRLSSVNIHTDPKANILNMGILARNYDEGRYECYIQWLHREKYNDRWPKEGKRKKRLNQLPRNETVMLMVV